MTERLAQEQLSQIITEVQWLQVRRDAELDRQQVKEILVHQFLLFPVGSNAKK